MNRPQPAGDPRTAAVLAYAEDATVLRLTARELYRTGCQGEAQDVRAWADIVDRASRAEERDPKPTDRPWCVCETCQAHLFAAHWKWLA